MSEVFDAACRAARLTAAVYLLDEKLTNTAEHGCDAADTARGLRAGRDEAKAAYEAAAKVGQELAVQEAIE